MKRKEYFPDICGESKLYNDMMAGPDVMKTMEHSGKKTVIC